MRESVVWLLPEAANDWVHTAMDKRYLQSQIAQLRGCTEQGGDRVGRRADQGQECGQFGDVAIS